MNKKQVFRDPFAFIFIGAIGFILITWFGSFFEDDPTPYIQGIENDYRAGEKAKSPAERKEAFNHSLESLLILEEKFSPTYGNGLLYLHIANNFFQLEDYPKAILYYNRAISLRPRDDNAQKLLSAAQAKLNISEIKNKSLFKRMFFMNGYLSLPERLQLFTLFGILTLAAASAYLWIKRQWNYHAFVVSLVCCSLILLGLIAEYYFSPLEGVLIRSSSLFRDAGEQYAKVIDDPLPSGQKVIVLSVSPSGKWLKIETSNGVMGYVPFESMQMI